MQSVEGRCVSREGLVCGLGRARRGGACDAQDGRERRLQGKGSVIAGGDGLMDAGGGPMQQ